MSQPQRFRTGLPTQSGNYGNAVSIRVLFLKYRMFQIDAVPY